MKLMLFAWLYPIKLTTEPSKETPGFYFNSVIITDSESVLTYDVFSDLIFVWNNNNHNNSEPC